jgi:hypothetical protein
MIVAVVDEDDENILNDLQVIVWVHDSAVG